MKQDASIAAAIKADDLEEAQHSLCIDFTYWSTDHILKVNPLEYAGPKHMNRPQAG